VIPPTKPVEATSSSREELPLEISIVATETSISKAAPAPLGKTEQIIQSIHEGKISTTWNIVGASVQGTSHLKVNLPCQDYHDYRVITDQTVIAAVADGLGSAAKSHEGSKIVVNTALTVIATAVDQNQPDDETSWTEIVKTAFSQARTELENYAQVANCPLREYGTTLIVAVINKDWLVTGHIGDGAAVALFEDGILETICLPQSGEYANQTIPITAVDALQAAQFSAQTVKVQAIALFSDGVQHLSINSLDHSPHLPFFLPIFGSLLTITDSFAVSQQLADYLASERVCAKIDDDKTLVLVAQKKN
jgi:serine/threonine protein phosphatase PrpC